MSASNDTVLNGDPKREAVDSMRGYSYQVLRSIEAWIDLDDGQVLVLEGAEDLDQLRGDGSASVEQVKNTAGKITLLSGSVLEAIGNFWEHLERNPSVAIQFRFLTTSGIGRERSRPFGFDNPGLEAWRRIQGAPDNPDMVRMAAAIQSFLKDQVVLPASLRDWLATAETSDFISRIVLPITWLTGTLDWRDLFETILAKLVELAEKRNIGSADAAAALDALHTQAWQTATTKGNRALRRGDLLRIVDQAGTTALPNHQIQAMLALITGGPSKGAMVSVAPEPFGGPPRATPRRHARPLLEGNIRAALLTGTVLIHGGTGMGKTGLAVAVVEHARAVAWVDMRDLPAMAAAARIDDVAARLEQLGQPHDVVLDDLPASGDARVLEAPLGRLRTVQDTSGGALLVTHPDRLASRLATQLLLDASGIFAAPAFDAEEIRDYLLAAGCPEGAADPWSKIIRASTSGHPQLVDARVAAMVEAGFPDPDITELLAPRPEIADVQAEARRLIATLPSDDRELLARASLLLGRAPRARLMAIAQLDPPIAEPGHVIDRLTGPWLERMDDEGLRPSPLLRNLGTDTRGPDWVTAMHRGIASSFLAGGSLMATDIFEIATHAMLGKSATPLIGLLPSLLNASAEVWAQVAETSSMLVYLGVGENLSLPFANPNDTAAFRVLQLRIALEADNQAQVASIVERALLEFDAAEEEGIPGPQLFELVFLWQFLQRPGSLALADRLRLALRFVRVGAGLADTFARVQLPEGVEGTDLQWPDLAPFVPMTLIPAVSDVDGLVELLSLIEGLEPKEQARALGGYAGESEAAALAMDRVWLGEASRPEPRWAELVATLRRVLSMAGELEVPPLSAAAAPLLVRVLDENVRDHEEALATADRLIAAMDRAPRLLAAKARVLWRHDRVREALDLYAEALPNFPLEYSWRTDVLRDAAVAAGKAGEWRLAAQRLTAAIENLGEGEPLVRRVGFLFDTAIALHLEGATRDSVDRLGEAVEAMTADGQEMPGEPLLSVRQLGSQVIKSIGAELGPAAIWTGAEMPLTRLFGSTSSLTELTWGEQRAATLDMVVLIMAELDIMMPEYPAIAERLARRLRDTPDLLAQSTQGDMLTRLAVRSLNVEECAADALREARALSFAAAERDAGREVLGATLDDAPAATNPQWQELVKYRLLARVVAMVARGKARAIPVQAWLEAMPTDGGMADVRAMLEDLSRLLAGAEDASSRVMGGNASWDRHLIAALLAPVQRRLSPEQLLICHAVAGRYLMQAKLAEFTGLPFSELVTNAWLDRCDSPAQLVSPRLSVPAIRRAATSSAPGWERVVAVLDEAKNAVSTAAARAVRGALQDIRDRLPSSAAGA